MILKRIKANVSYIIKGSDGSFEERVSYVHGMLTGKEFAHILTYLPEDAIEKIKIVNLIVETDIVFVYKIIFFMA